MVTILIIILLPTYGVESTAKGDISTSEYDKGLIFLNHAHN
ncbi:hypothetical protein SSIN_0599 [Streptococcus sinensis]|uniref:Uncharacterized protein n=1 Tax=Streptococcus sinensis TaxID=176090 RepID=A0A0A0DI80_9STRE|nr:hypothetical protein SSIN_0599 [Streptococcus sinensis]